jgi:YD repeat-containing protein
VFSDLPSGPAPGATWEALVETSEGEGTALRRTIYSYYTPADADWFEPGLGRTPLRDVVHPDGSWERHRYHATTRRKIERLSGFANQAPTDVASLVESVTYHYGSELGDPMDSELDSPRRVDRYRLGQLIGRTWYGYWADRTEEVRAVSANPVPTVPGNLKTVTHYETVSGIRRVTRIVHPDGLETRYTYPPNGSSEPEYVDQGVVQAGVVVNGTRTRTEIDTQGRRFRTTRQDLQPGGIVITTDVTHHTAFDVRGRPTITTYLGGEQVTRTYACCGLETETDRDGVTTTYGYDDSGRRISTTRHGASSATRSRHCRRCRKYPRSVTITAASLAKASAASGGVICRHTIATPIFSSAAFT